VSHIKSVLKRILQGVQGGESVICAAGLVTCTFLIFAQVLNRYWLHFPIMWLGDLALYVFIFFMLVAGALTTWREGHVSVDAFRKQLLTGKPKAMAVYRILMGVIAIALAGIFLFPAHKFMLRALEYPEYGTLVRWFNTSWLQITLFGAVTLILVHLLVIARRDVGDAIKSWHPRSRRQKI